MNTVQTLINIVNETYISNHTAQGIVKVLKHIISKKNLSLFLSLSLYFSTLKMTCFSLSLKRKLFREMIIKK